MIFPSRFPGSILWELVFFGKDGSEDDEGVGLEGDGGHVGVGVERRDGIGGVDDGDPLEIAAAGTEAEGDRVVVGVEEDGEGVAGDASAALVGFVDLVADEAHAEAVDVA